MTIIAVLRVDDGETLSDSTTFGAKPSIGEKVIFWKDGRSLTAATITAISHHQTEEGYILVVDAATDG